MEFKVGDIRGENMNKFTANDFLQNGIGNGDSRITVYDAVEMANNKLNSKKDFQINFEAAPQEVKIAATKANDAIKRLKHAEQQRDLWKKEVELAGAEWRAMTDSYAEVLSRFDTATNTMTMEKSNHV